MGLGTVTKIAMRGFEFFWALLVMALVGNMIAEASAGNPAVVNYSMFCAVFGMLSLFYLIPATLKDAFSISPVFPLVLDLLNTIFWFCGAVALAAELGVHSCSNKQYLKSNGIVNGSKDRSKRCTEAQASDAFLFFGFFAFATSTVFSGLATRGAGGIRPGGIRRSGPAMSQV